jgi:hypothetical protein
MAYRLCSHLAGGWDVYAAEHATLQSKLAVLASDGNELLLEPEITRMQARLEELAELGSGRCPYCQPAVQRSRRFAA